MRKNDVDDDGDDDVRREIERLRLELRDLRNRVASMESEIEETRYWREHRDRWED